MAVAQSFQQPINPEPQGIDELLTTVQALLENMIFCWSDLLFAAAMRPQIREAWYELDFQAMRADIAEADLSEVGLAGAQLTLKLSGLSGVLQPFIMAPSVRKLLPVFDWVLSILGSLAGVSRLLEQLKEFLEVLQKLIDWAGGQHPDR